MASVTVSTSPSRLTSRMDRLELTKLSTVHLIENLAGLGTNPFLRNSEMGLFRTPDRGAIELSIPALLCTGVG